MPSMMDDVANDLSLWIDQTAEEVARAFTVGGAPFAAQGLSEADKLEYYRAQLFNPDGTPNANGRNQEIQRLGAMGFAQVYKAVINAYPSLRVPTPPEITVPQEWPTAGPPAGPHPLALPPARQMPQTQLSGAPGPPPGPPAQQGGRL
jgi:hypothetical protein